jgi:hypothetical protein
MKIILLPGMSARNESWGKQLKLDLKKLGKDIDIIKWDHWKSKDSNFSIKIEEQKLLKQIGDEKDYMILAKSVGTRLLSKLISDGKLVPKKVILMGVPSTNNIYKKAFSNFDPEKVKVIQNTKDPLVSFSEIKEFFMDVNKAIEVIEVEESGHDYPYPDLIDSLI